MKEYSDTSRGHGHVIHSPGSEWNKSPVDAPSLLFPENPADFPEDTAHSVLHRPRARKFLRMQEDRWRKFVEDKDLPLRPC